MIEATNLTMRFGSTLALDGASFKVARGEIMGLLGPNGAGKTTAMNILATHLVPTSGTATIGGHDIHDEPVKVRSLLGYMPEDPPLYKEMEVAEYLLFVARARNLTGSILKERIEWVTEACALKPVYRKLIKALSRGYRQRVGLAQALVHDPEVIILDEPTTGLDPLQIISIRKLIRELAETKVVVFSTHLMQEASAITDRIVIIDQGRIIADSSLDELLSGAGTKKITVLSVKAPVNEVGTFLESVAGVSDIKELSRPGGYTCFEFCTGRESDACDRMSEMLLERGWVVREFADRPPSLEDVFITHIRDAKVARVLSKDEVSS